MKGDLQVDDRMDENPKKNLTILNISLVNVGMTVGHVSLIYIL